MGRAEELYETLVREGVSAVEKFIHERVSEELFLDFKRSENDGGGERLSSGDLKNLGKAISGFGNSSGGVIVWGVDCSVATDYSDVAKAKVYIKNPKRFRSWLEGAVSGRTLPPHNEVINHVIEVNDNKGFVVTFIPKSNSAPHQLIKEMRYYMRAGSDFLPVSHDLLVGMFGRRPQPKIVQQYLIKPAFFEGDNLRMELGVMLRNDGVGIASSVFLCADIISVPEGLVLNYQNQKEWVSKFLLDRSYTALGKSELKVPPTAKVVPMTISVSVNENTAKDVEIYANCGCDGGPTAFFELKSKKDDYILLYQELKRKKQEGKDFEQELVHFTQKFWGIGDFNTESPKVTGDIKM